MHEFNTFEWTLASPVVLLVFVLVFVVCLRVLPEMGFTGFSRKALAVCVAILSAMGLIMIGPRGSSEGVFVPWPDYFILLPYAALGLTLLLLPLVLLLAWWIHRLKECRGWNRMSSPRATEQDTSQCPKQEAIDEIREFEWPIRNVLPESLQSIDHPSSSSGKWTGQRYRSRQDRR